ncbi:NADH-quinone oxidoreductase subunit N [Rhodothalassium salexigens]|uniref:NADH-quinone oxidoreductase subunit NuoN n=1 Tax=Rhodothalassium salexigens TaxID=1086 RepID=UPI0019123AAA|nr:NADH-quinone oxidoreductase subunit NuoN [Rhodothalassium salexigens]MBK5911668.1 NADH-quinone oxidoreductase subunit N [Rhodothalassium salexigens]MBK5920961.1 NADH-quinone oxidoreductase subunit N [Rhodothalassium salexigens]
MATLTVTPVMAEILLAVGAMALLLVGVYGGKRTLSMVWTGSVALVVLAGAAVLWSSDQAPGVQEAFGGMVLLDGFAVFTKVLIAVGSAGVLVMSRGYLVKRDLDRFEYPVLAVLSTLGMFIMVSATDMLTVYVGLELQSLALYVLAAFARDRARSTEAGLKYFVLGALSSGMLLYGISLVYGFAGSTAFTDIAAIAAGDGAAGNIGLIVGLVFVLTGVAFKISAVPFHMWTPDVYEGAPTSVTAFFSAAPKVAAMALFVRIAMGAFGDMADQWQQVTIFLSVASMVVGTALALVQTNIKRLLAYSSITHVGYVLAALAAGGEAGRAAVIYYMAIYITMTAGAFGVVLCMRQDEKYSEEIADLAGLVKTRPALAVAMGILMISLLGFPPFLGFWAKYTAFLAVVDAGLVWLAVIGMIASVVGGYYYLRVVKLMFFDEPAAGFEPQRDRGVKGVVFATAVANSPLSVVLFGPLNTAAAHASRAFGL